MDSDAAPEVIERCRTARGELQLTRRGEHYEIIADGVFLMATYNGASEGALARCALDLLSGEASPLRVAVGGLGAGFTLAAALADPRVAEAVVIEVEPRLVAWAGTYLAGFNGGALRDPRTRVIQQDLVAWLRDAPPQGRFHAVLLDIDNGPDWTVHPGNAWLYGEEGLAALRERLAPGGALAVWSAHASPAFAARMAAAIGPVLAHRTPAPRGEDDWVYAARRRD